MFGLGGADFLFSGRGDDILDNSEGVSDGDIGDGPGVLINPEAVNSGGAGFDICSGALDNRSCEIIEEDLVPIIMP